MTRHGPLTSGHALTQPRHAQRGARIVELQFARSETERVAVPHMLRVPLDSIRLTGRNSQGVRLISLRDGDQLSSIAIISQADLEMAVPPEINGAGNGTALNGGAAPDDA